MKQIEWPVIRHVRINGELIGTVAIDENDRATWAVCSPKDQFSRPVSRAIVMARLGRVVPDAVYVEDASTIKEPVIYAIDRATAIRVDWEQRLARQIDKNATSFILRDRMIEVFNAIQSLRVDVEMQKAMIARQTAKEA